MATLGASALVGCTKEPEAMLEPTVLTKDAGVSQSQSQSYKLAQYLANGNQPSQGIVERLGTVVKDGRMSNDVRWEVDHEGIKYTVIVNFSLYRNGSELDNVRIWLNPLPMGKGTGESFLMDIGLDDLVDQGTISDKATLFNKSGKVLTYDPTVPQEMTSGWETGPQHKLFVQEVYSTVLETLKKIVGYQK